MEISELHNLYIQYPVISTDTRNILQDSIFFALKGNNFNGNEFAAKALQNGAKYAIIDEEKYKLDDRYILVHDVLKALQALAHYHRKQFKIPIIAITGTNGKTTTKELTACILSKQYNVLYTKGNLNNQIGVPLTLLQLNKRHEIAVIEMGASHVGDIKELCEIADPTFGLITNIGIAHIEGFGSFENLTSTKAELYDYIEQVEGKIFIDIDNEQLKKLLSARQLTSISYGITKDPDSFVIGEILENSPYLKLEWCIGIHTCFTVSTKIVGTYNLDNILAAITIGKYFGVNSASICEAVEQYTPDNNRSQLVQTEKNDVIVDAYNANPTSMKAALASFSTMRVTNKLPILGDMLELGSNSVAEHQSIINTLMHNEFEQAYLVGDIFSQVEDSRYKHFKNCDELVTYLHAHPLSDTYVLLKGSRGMKLEKALDAL